MFDAIEDGEPLASLSVTRFAPDVESCWDLLKANMAVPSTSENLDWFWGLMSSDRKGMVSATSDGGSGGSARACDQCLRPE